MTYCPACSEAGVPTCSDGLGDPVHIGAVLAEMGFDLRGRECRTPVLDAGRGTIGAQVKTAPGTRSANCESDSQGLADADRSAN